MPRLGRQRRSPVKLDRAPAVTQKVRFVVQETSRRALLIRRIRRAHALIVGSRGGVAATVPTLAAARVPVYRRLRRLIRVRHRTLIRRAPLTVGRATRLATGPVVQADQRRTPRRRLHVLVRRAPLVLTRGRLVQPERPRAQLYRRLRRTRAFVLVSRGGTAGVVQTTAAHAYPVIHRPVPRAELLRRISRLRGAKIVKPAWTTAQPATNLRPPKPPVVRRRLKQPIARRSPGKPRVTRAPLTPFRAAVAKLERRPTPLVIRRRHRTLITRPLVTPPRPRAPLVRASRKPVRIVRAHHHAVVVRGRAAAGALIPLTGVPGGILLSDLQAFAASLTDQVPYDTLLSNIARAELLLLDGSSYLILVADQEAAKAVLSDTPGG